MRKKNEELFAADELYSVSEYKPFRAEQYINVSEVAARAPETQPTPPETQFGNERHSGIKPKRSDSPSTQGGRRRASVKDFLSKLTETATSTVGTTVAVVGAAATVAICGSIYVPAPHVSLISLDVGADCVECVLDISELQENVDYDIVVSNAYHTFTQEEVTSGENVCFINELKPFYEYTLSVVGKTDDALGKTVYFEQSFYTGTGAEPKAFIDLTQRELDGESVIDYSLYVSDPLLLSNQYLVRAFYENEVILEESWTGQTTYEGSIPVYMEGKIFFSVYADLDGELRLVGEKSILSEAAPMRGPNIALRTDTELVEGGLFAVFYDISDENEQWRLERAIFHIAYDDSAYDVEMSSRALYEEGMLPVEIPADVTEFTVSADVFSVTKTGEERQISLQPQVYAAPHQVVLAEKKIYTDDYSDDKILTLRFFTHLPTGVTLWLTDTSTGDSTEITDSEYSETLTESARTFSYQALDEQGNVLIDEQTCTINVASSLPSFEFNYTNPGDYVETYNKDGTINLYTNVGFACDDENVYYEIVYYGGEISERVYRSRDPHVAFENMPDQEYYLVYYVIYEWEGVRYVLQRIAVSGNTGQDVRSYVDITVTEATVQVSLSSSVVLQGDAVIVVNGSERRTVAFADFVENQYGLLYSFDAGVEIVSVTVEMAATHQMKVYEQLLAQGSEMQGSVYEAILWEYTA